MAVNVAAPIVNVAAAPAPEVTVEHHHHIDVQASPAPQVTVTPQIDVHNTVEPAPVQVMPSQPVATEQTFTHGADGELQKVVTKPITH
jgi:hypothetical protein